MHICVYNIVIYIYINNISVYECIECTRIQVSKWFRNGFVCIVFFFSLDPAREMNKCVSLSRPELGSVPPEPCSPASFFPHVPCPEMFQFKCFRHPELRLPEGSFICVMINPFISTSILIGYIDCRIDNFGFQKEFSRVANIFFV